MTYTGVRKPNNRIIVAGDPLVQELTIETATEMYPGRLVKKGTADSDIVVNTAGGKAIGWLGYEQTNPVYRPEDVDSIYEKDASVAVLNGGKFYPVASLANGESVNKGDPLVGAANGQVKAASDLAVASGSETASAVDATTPTLEGSILPEGPIVAYVEESVDASGGAVDIIVRSVI